MLRNKEFQHGSSALCQMNHSSGATTRRGTDYHYGPEFTKMQTEVYYYFLSHVYCIDIIIPMYID